ncbi:MAG: hypothetical protein R3F61_24990 [Myxococcota bacterium]
MRRVADSHGGRVVAEESPAGGGRMRLSLPRGDYATVS